MSAVDPKSKVGEGAIPLSLSISLPLSLYISLLPGTDDAVMTADRVVAGLDSIVGGMDGETTGVTRAQRAAAPRYWRTYDYLGIGRGIGQQDVAPLEWLSQGMKLSGIAAGWVGWGVASRAWVWG